MKVLIRRLTDTARVPERGSSEAAGYDLFADLTEKTVLEPHTSMLVPTGLACAIPEGYFGGVFARSGLSLREGLRPANCVGVIDSDYRGELKVPLHNDSDTAREITPGEKVAQLVILPYLAVDFQETDDLGQTDRGTGGFGSTGQ